jgi:hypothetical protein
MIISMHEVLDWATLHGAIHVPLVGFVENIVVDDFGHGLRDALPLVELRGMVIWAE